MDKLHKEWQGLWREALGISHEPAPNDLGDDFALHFDMWNLDRKKQDECFSVFPGGPRILERSLEVLANPPKPTVVSDADLIELVNTTISNVQSVLRQSESTSALLRNQELLECTNRSVIRGDEELRIEVCCAEPLTIDLDDVLTDIIREILGERAYAAYFFLSEPLYRLAHCTQIAEWAIWGMLEPYFKKDPYEPCYQLYRLQAQSCWDGEKVIVFVTE